MFYALSIVSALVYLFLSFGAVFAPPVMNAYESLSVEHQNIMFVLAMLLAGFSGKALLVAAERRNMPVYMWSNWKENVVLLFVHGASTLMTAAYLWFGYQTGFFDHLEHGLVYAAFTIVVLVIFVGQAIYWALMFMHNRKVTK